MFSKGRKAQYPLDPHRKIHVTVKQFLWAGIRTLKNLPVEDRGLGNHAQSGRTDPFPVNYIFIHCCRLELKLLTKIEDLEGSLVCLERNDLPIPMHNGAISLDRSPDDLIVVFEVDDDDLWGSIFTKLLTHAHKVIRF